MAYADYWIHRAETRMADAQAGGDSTILGIKEAYDSAISQLNKDIDRVFLKYARDNKLTEAEARRYLNQKLSTKEIEHIRSRMHLIQDEEIKRRLTAQLDATLAEARISRLEAIREDIYIQVSRMADAELQHVTARYVEVIEEEFFRNMFDSQQYLGTAFSFSRIPVNTIRQILQDDWSGKHYSRRIWENNMVTGRRIEDTVKHLLLKGTMLGTNSRKMAAELDKLTNTGMYACERLIRTETTYFVAMADLEAARRRGTKKLQFVATLDNRTSEECREHDGSIINIEEAQPGKNLPPLHPFCRSVVIDVPEGLAHKVRTARDPKTGKNYKVPAGMDYKKWKKEFVDSGKLLVPEISNPVMKQAMGDFEAALEKNDDGSRFFEMLRLCKDNTTFAENSELEAAYGYNIEEDLFEYNPEHPSFDRYDMNFVYAHELGHRLDSVWTYRSWENVGFLKAIEATRKKLSSNEEMVSGWMDGNYGKDPGFSDIISALSGHRFYGITGHPAAYWQTPDNVAMEIFANMVYIKAMKSAAYAEREGFLKELFDEMEEMF